MLLIQNLSHTYSGGVTALQQVNLEIENGLFGLLGPNGAGKSTLMRILATLQQPTAGSIRFHGVDILRRPQELRPRLGYLPQDFGVYPRETAARLLNHLAVLKGVVNRKQRRRLVDDLLVETNLYEHRHRRVAAFSGGMRRRFGIAQALIGDPDLLIVDEPTAGLDPAERRRFHDLLVELGQHRVVLLSTHIVSDVADLCSKMAILAHGRIVAKGAPDSLLEPLRGRVWQAVSDDNPPAIDVDQGRVLTRRLSGGRRFIRLLADSPPAHFQASEATLEDVYFLALQESRQDAAAVTA